MRLSSLVASLCILSSCAPKGVDLQLEPLGTQEVFSNLEKEEHVHVLKDDDHLQFTDDLGQIKLRSTNIGSVKKGDVLVGNASNPVLLKVASDVTQEKDGSLSMRTKLAKFSDLSEQDFQVSVVAAPHIRTDKSQAKSHDSMPSGIITQATGVESNDKFRFDDKGNIHIQDLNLYHFKLGKSGTLAEMKTGLKKSSKLEQNLKISNAGEGEFSAKISAARFHFHPTFRSKYSFSGAKIKDLNTRLDMKFIYEMEIIYNNTSAIKMDLSYELLPQIKVPIRIPGAVPVYIDLEIDLPAGIRVSASKANEVRVKYKGQYNIFSEMSYDVASGLTSHGDQGFLEKENKIIDDSTSNTYSAELYLEPKLSARFYRVLGPYAYFTPYVKAEVEKPAKAQRHELFMGLRGGMGLQVSEPIFMSNILDLSSPDLFNVYRSWDIFSESSDEKLRITKQDIKPKAKEKIFVSELTAEGFFVFKLADPELKNSVGFTITQQPKNGFMIPAPGFHQTGRIYYFPKNKKDKFDSFSFSVDRNGLKSDSHKVAIELADDILEYNNREKFGATTSSVEVAYASPYQREGYAKHYQIGGDAIFLASRINTQKIPGMRLSGHNQLQLSIPTRGSLRTQTVHTNDIKVSRSGLVEIPNVFSKKIKTNISDIENFVYNFSFCKPVLEEAVQQYFDESSLVLDCQNSTRPRTEFTMIQINHELQLGFLNEKLNGSKTTRGLAPSSYGLLELSRKEAKFSLYLAKSIEVANRNIYELNELELRDLNEIRNLESITDRTTVDRENIDQEGLSDFLNESIQTQLNDLKKRLEEIKFLRQYYLPIRQKNTFMEGMVHSEDMHEEEYRNFEEPMAM